MYNQGAQVFDGANEYTLNGFDNFGTPQDPRMLNQQAMGYETNQNSPSGGIVAFKMPQNPYLTHTGKFRKPRQDEMIKEIQIFKGLEPSGRAVRISDVNNKIRHCCVSRPYFHVLDAEKYAVRLPANEIEIIYYFHRECGTLIVVGDTLSE